MTILYKPRMSLEAKWGLYVVAGMMIRMSSRRANDKINPKTDRWSWRSSTGCGWKGLDKKDAAPDKDEAVGELWEEKEILLPGLGPDCTGSADDPHQMHVAVSYRTIPRPPFGHVPLQNNHRLIRHCFPQSGSPMPPAESGSSIHHLHASSPGKTDW
jgi:hypothetical protein